jgi:hypothetical protein
MPLLMFTAFPLLLDPVAMIGPYLILIGLGLGLVLVAVGSLVYQWRHVRRAEDRPRQDDSHRR